MGIGPAPLPLAPPPFDGNRKTLARIVRFIGIFLDWLLNQAERFDYTEDVQLLREEFEHSIRPKLDELVTQIGNANSDEIKALEGEGLTGRMLKMKWTLLYWDVKRSS